MPATAGGSTSGSSISVTTRSRRRDRRVAAQYAVGVPSTRIRASAMRFVSNVTTSASFATSLRSAETSSPGGTRRKIATIGSSRKPSATRRRQDERAAEETVYDDAFGSGRNPAFLSAVWPFADRTILTHARAAALFGDFDTTAIS